jgi:hypothetical protein
MHLSEGNWIYTRRNAKMKTRLQKLKDLLRDIELAIIKYDTPTTFELVGAHYKLREVDMETFIDLGLDIEMAHKMIKMSIYEIPGQVGPYHTQYYIDMFKQLENLCTNLTEASIESRQFTITFPAKHCFQSIQVLFRGENVYCIAYMRSCNFKKNFLMDAYLTYYCGLCMKNHIQPYRGCTNANFHVIMNIGSLHIFKNEV